MARPGGLRVGRIDFANCTPLFMALEEAGPLAGVRFVRGVPSELNRMLREGEVDVAPSSAAEYLAHPEFYGFLPDLSISSIGRVASVALFSRAPLQELHGRPVGLTPASASSVLLLRVLLEGHFGLKPVYAQPAAGQDAVLWIGDRALQEVQAGSWPFVYDLGELWYRETGTPFVFALWIVRRDAFSADPGGVRSFYRRLVEARQRAYRSYPNFARTCGESAWMTEQGLLDYWQTISYDLTAWHLEGLRLYAEEAARLGLVESMPPLAPLPVEGS